MKRQQIVFVLVVAMLCVAATAITHEGPGRSVGRLSGRTDHRCRRRRHLEQRQEDHRGRNGDEIDYGSKLNVELDLDDDLGW